MRHTIIILAILTAGGLSSALADAPTAPASQSASATATAPKAPAADAAKATESTSDDDEKQLLAQGYKVRETRSGKVYCKREVPIGSTLPVTRCITAEQAKQMAKEGRELIEQQQRGQGR